MSLRALARLDDIEDAVIQIEQLARQSFRSSKPTGSL